MRVIQTKIYQIPQELSKLYEELFINLAQDDMQDSLRLMRWINFGSRSLSLRELRTAMAVDACSSSGPVDHYHKTGYYVETDEAMERQVCDLSRGLAEVVQHGRLRVVQFVHQTVIEFLIGEGFQLLDRSQRTATADTFAGRSHFRISDVCIRYLASVALPPYVYPSIMIHEYLDLNFPLLGYSVVYWIEHAQKCEGENLSSSSLLSYFDRSSLLQSWHSMCMNYASRIGWELSWPTTIIHVTSRYNLVHALDSILNQSANVDLKDQRGQTPLSIAARQGHESIVKLLLKRNDIGVNSKYSNRRTPLSYAAWYGHEGVVQLLLEPSDIEPDSKESDNRTPLSYVAEQGHENTVQMLLKRNDIKADLRNPYNLSPLLYAAAQGHEEIVKLLLKRNDVEADLRDMRDRSPLSWATGYGSEAVVELLLEQDDVVIDSVDDSGITPLSWASRSGHEGL